MSIGEKGIAGKGEKGLGEKKQNIGEKNGWRKKEEAVGGEKGLGEKKKSMRER